MRRARPPAALTTVLALVALLAGCGGGGTRQPDSAAVGPVAPSFGMSADFVDQSETSIRRGFADYRSIGLSWARVSFAWPRVQETPGGPYDWSEYDLLVNRSKEAGVRLIGLLTDTPAWARSSDCEASGGWELACPPEDVAGFAAFAEAAAARYKDDGIVWEVWNEPNLTAFWRPAPDVEAYTGLLVATSRAVKRGDADATVVSAGLSAASDAGGPGSIDALDFLEGMYGAGAGGHVDGIGWHPYLTHRKDEPPPVPGRTDGPDGWTTMAASDRSARSLMTANGDGAKKIWVTEFGANTEVPSMLSADEPQQAEIAAAAVREWKSYDWAAAFCFYTYRDISRYGESDDSERFFGLWRIDGSAKPAVDAVRTAIAATP